MSVKKFTRLWTIIIAVVTVLAIVVSIVLTGPLYTVMNMYFGKGDAVIKQNEFASSLDGDYYKLYTYVNGVKKYIHTTVRFMWNSVVFYGILGLSDCDASSGGFNPPILGLLYRGWWWKKKKILSYM